jgi:hypothetical protein
LAHHKEQEASLLICSENPEFTYRLVTNLTSIETSVKYGLLPQSDENIYDIYFDTEDETLDSKKYTLRIREIHKECEREYSINLKQPSTSHIDGIDDRPEREEQWTLDSLHRINRILRELEKMGLKNRQLNSEDLEKTPMKVMSELNFKPIQKRYTDRKVRTVVQFNYDGKNIKYCEIDIDSVVYCIQIKRKNVRARLYDLEIEGKPASESTFKVISSLKTALIKKFSPYLIEWNYSKFKTGKILKQLLDEIEVSNLIDTNDNLRCNTYEIIKERIENTEGNL